MLRNEWAVASWAGSTGVIPRPYRKQACNNACVVFRRVSEVNEGPNSLEKRGGKALVTPLVLRVSMGGGDRLTSGDPYARLPSYLRKKRVI